MKFIYKVSLVAATLAMSGISHAEVVTCDGNAIELKGQASNGGDNPAVGEISCVGGTRKAVILKNDLHLWTLLIEAKTQKWPVTWEVQTTNFEPTVISVQIRN